MISAEIIDDMVSYDAIQQEIESIQEKVQSIEQAEIRSYVVADG